MKMVDVNYLSAILEEIRDPNKAILEAYSLDRDNVRKIPKIDERLEKLEYDMPMVKLATSQTSSDMKLIKIRTEKIVESLDDLKTDVKNIDTTVGRRSSDHEKRITKLETAPRA